MFCLPYAGPDSFGCENRFQTCCVDVASLVSPPADFGRLTAPSASLWARHSSGVGDAPGSLVSPLTSKSDLARLTAKHQGSSIGPSVSLPVRLDNGSGGDADFPSSSMASFRYQTHSWSRNVGIVCGCTPFAQTENILTHSQKADSAFQNDEKLDVLEIKPFSENHIIGMSPSEQTSFSGSNFATDASEAQASGITEGTQCLEPPFYNRKPSMDKSYYGASLAATSNSQQSVPFLSNTVERQHIGIKPLEHGPKCGSPTITPGLSTMDSGAMISEVTQEIKHVKGSCVQPSLRMQAAQVNWIDLSLDSVPWQESKPVGSGSHLHAEVGIEEDQGHLRGFSMRRQMADASQHADVESDRSENSRGFHGFSSHAEDERATQHFLKGEPLGSSYVPTDFPDSQQVLTAMNSAREEPSNDTDNLSVVRLPAYRTSCSNWSSKFTESVLYLESMGVNTGKLIREEPSVVTYDIKRLRELVCALEGLGLYWKDLGKVFNLCPRVIHLSPAKDLKLVTDFLFDEAGLSPKDLSKVIKRCPRLLACDVVDQLLPTLMFLRTLGFSNMGQVIANNATLLSLNVEKKLVPKLKYLESLGFTHRHAVSMVVRFPALFNYKVKENLEPKYEYLVYEMGGSNKDLLAFPQYFGFSLANRIIPRYQCIAKQDVFLSIQAMLKLSEAEFNARFHCVCEQGPSSKQQMSDVKIHDCAMESTKFVSSTYPRTPILVGAKYV